MDIALLVTATPAGNGQAALDFAQAAVRSGHRISQVFFYMDGVVTAAAAPASDTPASPLGTVWLDFAGATSSGNHDSEQQTTELLVCVGAATRRGLLGAAPSKPAEQQLAAGFVVAGLGQLVAATVTAERVVTFA